MTCFACKSISGEKRISPGPFIYEGKYWIVDHAYPTKLLSWLVIVLKRHKEALHELTVEEYKELFILQEKTIKLLYSKLRSKKEYIACFSEGEHFKHIHFHIIPRSKNLSNSLMGPKIFSLLTEKNPVPIEQVLKLSQKLRRKML